MLGSFADIVALAFAGLAIGATVLGRLPQRQGLLGLSQLRTKGAIVGAGVAVVPATATASALSHVPSAAR